MSGGGQERGMRSGTLSPALCGIREACKIYQKKWKLRIKNLQSSKMPSLKVSEVSVMKSILTVPKRKEFLEI